MFRAAEVQEALLPLVGWEQDYIGSNIKIDESLTKSESGLYFQQVHPLLTLQNLACIAPDFYNNKSDEDANAAFSEWLKRKTKASIQKAISRFYNEKVAKGAAKVLCENRVLFTGTGRLNSTVTNKNRLVGFEIVPIRALGVTTKINRIGLQFTKPGSYTIYLRHSSQAEIDCQHVINIDKPNQFVWVTISDMYLPFKSETIDAGGSWYLYYLQNELPVGSQAIYKDRDWSKGPCRSCSRADFILWQAWSPYLEIHPFYVTKYDGVVWDPADMTYTYDNNYGLNLDVTVKCDYTDFIIEQRSIFQDIIMKQVGVDMLREMAYNANARTNRHSINAGKVDLLMALDGVITEKGNQGSVGLVGELDIAMKAIKLNTQGLDRVCLPCVNNGVRYRVV